MTDYELLTARELMIQSVTALVDTQASYTAIYLSMVFAYTTVAYLAGKNLSKLQILIVTSVYFFSSLYTVLVIVAMSQTIVEGQVRIAELFGHSDSFSSNIIGMSLWLDMTIWPLAMLASLIFMWHMRREN